MEALVCKYSESLRKVKREFCSFLNRWEWDWYVTLTYRGSPGITKAKKLFRLWLGCLEEEEKIKPYYVRFLEWQKRGVPHFHLLMGNMGEVKRLKWMDRWYDLAGIARIYPYNRNLGAGYYLGKYLFKDSGEIEICRLPEKNA